MKSPHAAGVAALLFITLVWSTTFPIAKSAFDHLSPALLTAARFIISALLLAPRLKGLTKSEARLGIILGVLQFLCVAAVFQGLLTTNAGRSAFLISLSVFMVPIANLVLRKPVGWVHLAAAAIALVGVWLFTGGSAGRGLTAGDWWTILSAALFAAYMLIIEAAGPQKDALRQSAVQLVVVAILACAWLVIDGVPPNVLGTLQPVWITVVYLGLCAICTTSLQVWGQRYVSAQESALIFILEPVLATVWSYLFLAERLAPAAFPGAVLIIGANLWSQMYRSKES